MLKRRAALGAIALVLLLIGSFVLAAIIDVLVSLADYVILKYW